MAPSSSSDKKYIEIDDDDELEIVQTESDGFPCAICNEPLKKLSPEQRQEHYDRHLSNDKSDRKSSKEAEGSARSKINWVKMPARYKTNKDPFWYPAKAEPPPHNFTPGLISLLKKSLNALHEKGTTRRAVLCYDKTVHISRDVWDANWGCGYRNFEMICTALMDQQIQPRYFPLLNTPISPSVRNLQKWIETAWEEGFDPEGAQQLKKLVDTKTWIGTSDIWVAFSFRGIPAELVDFDSKGEKDVAEKVIDWVVKYFSPPDDHSRSTVDDALRHASPVICTECMPFILQHKGHSRTIVGYEVTKKGAINLLSFDPSKIIKSKIRELALAGLGFGGHATLSKAMPTSPRGLRQFFNSIPKKRGAGDPNEVERPQAAKRSRTEVEDSDDDDVIIVEDSRDGEASQNKGKNKEEFNYADILKSFRIEPQKLRTKDQYQVLYFPLEDPLDERQRLSRKEVVAVKAC